MAIFNHFAVSVAQFCAVAKLLLILIFAGALVDELVPPSEPPLLIDNGSTLDAAG